MPQDYDQIISRKLTKQRQHNVSPQQDFVAKLGAKIISQRMQNASIVRSRNSERVMHLYCRGNEVSVSSPRVFEQIDQLPFRQIDTSIPRTMSMLPFGQYDVVYSNLVFDWLNAGEFIRMQDYLLAPEGTFWFSCFGPLTAIRSRSILSEIDLIPRFNEFYEMRDIGDALLGAGFKDVVLESTITTLEYDSVEAVMADAIRVFGVNAHPDRHRNMTHPRVLKQFKLRLKEEIRANGKFTEQLEILVAHGRKSSVSMTGGTIPVRQG
jgi:hypothetical protein